MTTMICIITLCSGWHSRPKCLAKVKEQKAQSENSIKGFELVARVSQRLEKSSHPTVHMRVKVNICSLIEIMSFFCDSQFRKQMPYTKEDTCSPCNQGQLLCYWWSFCAANVSVFCLADILRTRRQKKTDWGHQVEVIRKPKQIKVAFFFSFQFSY